MKRPGFSTFSIEITQFPNVVRMLVNEDLFLFSHSNNKTSQMVVRGQVESHLNPTYCVFWIFSIIFVKKIRLEEPKCTNIETYMVSHLTPQLAASHVF
jgi:hypothetical protein